MLEDRMARAVKDPAFVERFWSRVRKSRGCWEWAARIDKHGYGRISSMLAHRVSWSLANKRAPGTMFVIHSCDNPACCRPDHLRLGTNTDNMRDMVVRGRSTRRPGFGSILDERDVVEIRRLALAGHTKKSIAERYGVAQSTVCMAVSRRNWKHVH